MTPTTLQPIRPPLWLNAADVALAWHESQSHIARLMTADLKRKDAGLPPKVFPHIHKRDRKWVRVPECCVMAAGRPHEEAKMPPLFALPEVGR